jgi:hypothetical protein
MNAVSNMPTAVKVLKHLRETSAPSTSTNISRAVREGQTLVDKALAELVARGLLLRNSGDYYQYRKTPEADQLCQRLFALYDKLSTRPGKELLVRGLLSQPSPRYLWHVNKLLEVIEREGFSRKDAIQFLDGETGKGYIKKVRMIFVARTPFVAPPFIPYYYMSGFRNIDPNEYDKLTQQCHSSGLLMNEESYLMGAYPPELSQPAIQYVEKEKRQMRDTLWEEAFKQWQGLTYSW